MCFERLSVRVGFFLVVDAVFRGFVEEEGFRVVLSRDCEK